MDNQLKSIYKSAYKASYIKGFNDPGFIKKSRLQIEQETDKNIDQKTFKIMTEFIRPKDDFIIHKKTGRCHLQEQGFFGCFSNRKAYEMSLINSKLYITAGDNICRFIDFNAIWADVDDRKDGFVISFQQSSVKIYIEPISRRQKSKQEQSAQWVKLLKQIIKTTDGKNKKYQYLLKNQLDFYRTQHVLNQEFEKCANSLDIVLFKSKHSAATAQRLFTNSQYDHVGVVLRNKKNQLSIYESTSDSGVGFTAWKHLVRYQWYQSIDKIVWRPLQIQLTKKDVQVIEAFVVKTLGKEFQISLGKLFQFKSALKRTQEVEQSKTYFCSELVARLYKELGLLNDQKASTNYYPVDFSDKGFLQIIRPNVTLKNQRLISFDKFTQ